MKHIQTHRMRAAAAINRAITAFQSDVESYEDKEESLSVTKAYLLMALSELEQVTVLLHRQKLKKDQKIQQELYINDHVDEVFSGFEELLAQSTEEN